MEAACTVDAQKAVRQIASANNISLESMVVVLDEACDYTIESLKEAGVVMERAAEADATNITKIRKWYKRFIVCSKDTKGATKRELQDRINVLEQCIKSMKNELHKAKNGDHTGRAKYTLKAFIPFNAIYRLIKIQDVYAGIGLVTGWVTGIGELVVRAVFYEKMLEDQIDATQEAVDYLKEKLNDFD